MLAQRPKRTEATPSADPSVLSLLAAEPDTANAEDAIRRRARSLVREALELGWQGPPFDVTELASLRGLKVEQSYGLKRNQHAGVVPGRILVNAGDPRVRQRLSVAHEVIHTVFPDYEQRTARLGQLWRQDGDRSELEQLCQVGASELLFPFESFCEHLRRLGVSLPSFLWLADTFDGSLEATARRAVDVCESRNIVLFLSPPDSVGVGDYRPLAPLAVKLACASPCCGDVDIPAGAAIPRRSAPEKAWKRVCLDKGTTTVYKTAEDWSQVVGLGPWRCEALTLPRGSTTPHEVLCLLSFGVS